MNTITVWRLQQQRKDGAYTYRFSAGRKPHRKAQIAGEFKKLYDPVTGENQTWYTYWGNDTWPQPKYKQLLSIWPFEREG